MSRLRRATRAAINEAYAIDEAQVEVTLADGRTIRKHVDHPVGSLERPLSDGQLEEKLRALSEGVLTDAQVNALIAAVWSLDRAENAGVLADACQALR